jgi:hypothetical protein
VELVQHLRPRIPNVKHFIAFGKKAVPGMLSPRNLLGRSIWK